MKKVQRAAGRVLFEQVSDLVNQHTDDSVNSKITNMPEEYQLRLLLYAKTYSSLSYTPIPTPDVMLQSKLYVWFWTHQIFGFNLYVTERSFRTNHAPFRYDVAPETIDRAELRVLRGEKGKEIIWWCSQPALAAIDLAATQVKERISFDADEVRLKGYRLHKMWAREFVRYCLCMGYSFAHEVITPQIPLDDNWPEKLLGKDTNDSDV